MLSAPKQRLGEGEQRWIQELATNKTGNPRSLPRAPRYPEEEGRSGFLAPTNVYRGTVSRTLRHR